jgi:hypothetical protein
MSNIFDSINEDAEKLANHYSFLVLKTAYHNMKDLSDYDKQVMQVALNIHRQRIKEDLNKENSTK